YFGSVSRVRMQEINSGQRGKSSLYGSPGHPFVCCTLIICVLFSNAAAQTTVPSSRPATRPLQILQPLCGLYSLYTCWLILGKQLDLRTLLLPEYLGSPKGSSISELEAAAHDHGLFAMPLGGMTSSMLRDTKHPLILHVKGNAASSEYDHFFVCVG